MTRQSFILGLACLTITCVALQSCDKRQKRQEAGDSGDVNLRTKRAQRAELRDDSKSSEAPQIPPEKLALPAQSTDESIAEWAWSMMETRPDLVEQAIRELKPDSPEREALIRTYVIELVGRSPDEAITWANSLGDPASILAAREEIAMALPPEQIDRSVQLLLDPVRISRQGFDNSSARLLERWVAHNPEAAARWVMVLPSGASRETGVRSLATEWLQRDAKGALQWLSSQAAAQTRGEISRAMAQAILETEETQREELLESASPAIRQELEQQIHSLQPPPPAEESENQSIDAVITD